MSVVDFGFEGSIEDEKEETKHVWRVGAKDPRFNSAESRTIKESWRPRSWAAKNQKKNTISGRDSTSGWSSQISLKDHFWQVSYSQFL